MAVNTICSNASLVGAASQLINMTFIAIQASSTSQPINSPSIAQSVHAAASKKITGRASHVIDKENAQCVFFDSIYHQVIHPSFGFSQTLPCLSR